MKRRISDLIAQADFRPADGSAESGPDGRYIATYENLEKFAELVIQECSVELDANRLAVYDANLHHEYWNCGVKWAVAKLKNHFGEKMKYIDCAKF